LQWLGVLHLFDQGDGRVRIVDGLGLEVDDWQIVRAQAGAEKAAKLATERGVEMPSDPWGVR